MLSYNGNLIIPAPLVTIDKVYNTTQDGTKLSARFNFTLNGTLLPDRGSPNSSGYFYTDGNGSNEDLTDTDDKFRGILRKQEALRQLFAAESGGFSLEWQPSNGSPPARAYPTLESINFKEDSWVQRCDYTINLSADKLYMIPGADPTEEDFGSEYNQYNLESASDSWQMQETDDGTDTIKVTHTVTAKSRLVYEDGDGTSASGNAEPWEFAREWAKTKINPTHYNLGQSANQFLDLETVMGPDLDPSGLSLYKPYSRIRTEQPSRVDGSYTITETWTLSKNPVIEVYSVKQTAQAPDVQAASPSLIGHQNTYSINGSIKGLQSASGVESRYGNARSHLDTVATGMVSRIKDAVNDSSITLKSLSQVITRNVTAGIITYEFSFNDSDFSSSVFDTVTITVEDDDDADIAAVIPVPGRTTGPVIQNLSTDQPHRRIVRFVGILTKDNSGTPWDYGDLSTIRSEVNTLLSSFSVVPTGTRETDYWVTSQPDNYDLLRGTFTKTVTYLIKG